MEFVHDTGVPPHTSVVCIKNLDILNYIGFVHLQESHKYIVDYNLYDLMWH